METINQNDRHSKSEVGAIRYLFWGAVLVLGGAVWLLHNLGLMPDAAYQALISWNSALMLMGIYFITLKRWVIGGVAAVLGLSLLVLKLLQIDIPVWNLLAPICCIVVGATMLFTSRNSCCRPKQ